jgi:DNA-binding transcriptional LysR family regulator
MAYSKGLVIPSLTEGDLRLLSIFRIVAEAGGFTAAETRLRMERSTISRHVQTLEARLGARLCHRGPSGFELTEFGQAAVRASIAACDTLETVRNELNTACNVIVGELRIGIADNCITNPQSKLIDALKSFKAQAPDVMLDIRIRPPRELVEDLIARRIHIGIAGLPLNDDRLSHEDLFVEEFRLYSGPDVQQGDVHIRDVAKGAATLIIREHDPRSLALARRFNIERTAIASGLEAVATLIASGGYVGYLPTHYVESLAPLGPFREVQGAEDLQYRVPFSTLLDRTRTSSPATALFREHLSLSHRILSGQIGGQERQVA